MPLGDHAAGLGQIDLVSKHHSAQAEPGDFEGTLAEIYKRDHDRPLREMG